MLVGSSVQEWKVKNKEVLVRKGENKETDKIISKNAG